VPSGEQMGWWWCEQRGRRAAQIWKCTNAERQVNMGRGVRFPVMYSSAESHKYGCAKDRPCAGEVREEWVSNVIYQVCI